MEARDAPSVMDTEPARWLRLLPRVVLLFAIEGLALLLVALVALGMRSSDLVPGQDYAKLLQAVRSPEACHPGD